MKLSIIIATAMLAGCSNSTLNTRIATLQTENNKLRQEIELDAARLDEVRAQVAHDNATCLSVMSGINAARDAVLDSYKTEKPAVLKAVKDAYNRVEREADSILKWEMKQLQDTKKDSK